MNIRPVIIGIYALVGVVAPVLLVGYVFGLNSSFFALDRSPAVVVACLAGIVLSFCLGYLFVRSCESASSRPVSLRERFPKVGDEIRKEA